MLAFALMIVGTLIMLGSGILTLSFTEHRASRRSLSLSRAMHLSEAGVDRAIQQLRANPGYAGTAYTELGNGVGGYAIQVTASGPSQWVITATGSFPTNNAAAADYAAKTIEAVVQLAKGAGLGYGVLGDRAVRFNGGGNDDVMSVDSYDSRQGPYSPSAARANVQVRTNGTQDGAMRFDGRVSIKGDVVLAPGSDPATTLRETSKSWTSIVGGELRVAEEPAPIESVEMPMLQDEGCLCVSGDSVVTVSGDLHLFNEIRVSGQGRVVFTEPTQIYVKEGMHISGNGQLVAAAQLPTNLTLYVQGPHVSINGRADLFVEVIAPNATVDLSGTGELYGAVSGQEIVASGRVRIHYDEALNRYDAALNAPRPDAPLQASLLSWREL